MAGDVGTGIVEKRQHAHAATIFMGEAIPHQVRHSARHNRGSSAHPHAPPSDSHLRVLGEQVQTPGVRKHRAPGRLDQGLKQRPGEQPGRQTESQQCQRAMGLRARQRPGEQQAEIGHHAANHGR